MTEVLGAGQNRAYISTRDGRSLLMEVPLASVEWNRTLCAVSPATLVVDPARCTSDLARIHPWAHGVVVYRDEDRVWEGPVRLRREGRTGLTLTASDVIGHLDHRDVRTHRDVEAALVRNQMRWAVDQGFAPDDPNVLAHVQELGAATRTADLQVGVAEKMHAAVLSDLTASGGRWTALGRSILLWDDAASIGTLRDLSPENHLLSDVEVIEDGELLATVVRARNDNGVVGSGIHTGGTATDPYYGYVGQVVASAAKKPAGVRRTAESTAQRTYPTPVSIEVPADAALRCDAPFPITSLVPGVIVPVSTTTATSREVSGSFILTSVKVTQTAGQDEQVAVTLTPISEALT